MNGLKAVESYLILVPVAFLLLVGGMIALQSGVHHISCATDLRRMVGNFSQMVLRVAGYVAALIVVQYFIGLRPALGW